MGNKFKIVLSYIQVVVLFRVELNGLRWPPFMNHFFGFFNLLNFDFVQFSPAGCATDADTLKPFQLRIYMYVYAVLGSTVALALFALVLGSCRVSRRAGKRAMWNAVIYKWTG